MSVAHVIRDRRGYIIGVGLSAKDARRRLPGMQRFAEDVPIETMSIPDMLDQAEEYLPSLDRGAFADTPAVAKAIAEFLRNLDAIASSEDSGAADANSEQDGAGDLQAQAAQIRADMMSTKEGRKALGVSGGGGMMMLR